MIADTDQYNEETQFVLKEALKLKFQAGHRAGKLELWTSNKDILSNLDRKGIEAATLCQLTTSDVGDSRFGRFLTLTLPNSEGKYDKDSETFSASEEWTEELEKEFINRSKEETPTE